MKIAVLSGAYGNAGDSLIEKRCVELMEHIIPEATVSVVSRRNIPAQLDQINACDLVAFSGGPIYQRDISRNFSIPAALSIQAPLVIIGGGWKGSGRCLAGPYMYDFSENTRRLLEKVENNHGLSCRDIYTAKALRNAGFQNVVMTGCPAWYDLQYVHSVSLRDNHWNLKKIYVSDPANTSNYDLVVPLVEHLHEMFREAEINFVFHRSTSSEKEDTLRKALEGLGYVAVQRLRAQAESFQLYNECDLHIGFRVHAHIYNLSQRKKSILIEEDGRGAGVNEALGLPGLLAYHDQYQPAAYSGNDLYRKAVTKLSGKLYRKTNPFLLHQIDDYCAVMEQCNGMYYENAFKLMEKYYMSMEQYLLNIQKGIGKGEYA